MAVPWSEIEFGARLADMQEVDYRNTLAVATLIELLIEHGVITPEELRRKSAELDRTAAHSVDLHLD